MGLDIFRTQRVINSLTELMVLISFVNLEIKGKEFLINAYRG